MQEIEKIFGPDGDLSKHLPGYSPRAGQLAMAREVWNSLSSGKHLLVEAGTGVGKSMAHSIPAGLWAMQENNRVIVATANITLQEQLVNKDLPLIKKVLEPYGDLDFRLVKGKGNYVCLTRLKLAQEEFLENEGELPQWLSELGSWAAGSETGDKSEAPKDYGDDWSTVNCQSGECLKEQCPHDCFLKRARSMLALTQVIVTNYDFLYSDLVIKWKNKGTFSLLPDYGAIIMDEAHSAAPKAMTFQGFDYSIGKMLWPLSSLSKIRNPKADSVRSRCRKAIQDFYKALDALRGRDGSKIITAPLQPNNAIAALEEAAGFYGAEARKALKEGGDRGTLLASRFTSRAGSCKERAEHLKQLSTEFAKGAVYAVEQDRTGSRLVCKMVDVQPFFRNIFDETTTIMTSATLSTAGNFNFVTGQLGLTAGEYASLIAPSPFNEERMLIAVPFPFPVPNENPQKHTEAAAESVYQLAKELDGKVMALFSSYRAMKYVAQVTGERLKREGFEVLVQGAMPKSRIIDRFKECYAEGIRAVILATASFWEGVDIPGQALTCVVIDKLPFIPPSDPVLYYIDERTSKSGFFDYQIPQVIIRLKQGLGRLIRTEQDYGAVVVLDPRIHTKGYGSKITCSLPENCFMSEDLEDVKEFISGFNQNSQGSGGDN